MSVSEKERENMSLYSVLLVDDEEEVFQVIMKKAGLGRYGLSHCGLCKETVWKRLRWRRSFPWMSS